eukprot:GFYU01004696.1.p1 GENE.GFYU01004696.1~~GFYU01004696.1.p1  ORF type:complete len:767 (+),score=134.26 GFYU01004696.1:39-2303(+)
MNVSRGPSLFGSKRSYMASLQSRRDTIGDVLNRVDDEMPTQPTAKQPSSTAKASKPTVSTAGASDNFVKLNMKRRYGKGGKFSNKRFKKFSYMRSRAGEADRWTHYHRDKERKKEELFVQMFGDDGEPLKEVCSRSDAEDDGMDVVEDQVKHYSDQDLKEVLSEKFGIPDFRDGQLQTVQRILQQQSTLLISPTGSGKSLCYQVPALLMDGVTLVISPLISLMKDQHLNLPQCLRGAVLDSSTKDHNTIQRKLVNGEVDVLFISPERLCGSKFLDFLGSIPRIAFACIDEAHCISEWSHNFRTAYLQIHRILRDELKVKTVLAMTATATYKTALSIRDILGIQDGGIIRGRFSRDHIKLTASKDSNNREALVKLLSELPRRPTVIYVLTQREADDLAVYLGAKRYNCKSYHAGKLPQQRSSIQKAFLSNQTQIIVATVAFGMGINKNDIGCVIHFTMPSSVESYVQEIGRCGRNGEESYCHMFLQPTDYYRLRSLAYSNVVDEAMVKKLLVHVFYNNSNQVRKESEVMKIVSSTYSVEWDMKPEIVMTILTYLEQMEDKLISVVPVSTREFMGASSSKKGRDDAAMVIIMKELEDPMATIRTLAKTLHAKMCDHETRQASKVDAIYSIMEACAAHTMHDALHSDSTGGESIKARVEERINEYFNDVDGDTKTSCHCLTIGDEKDIVKDICAFIARYGDTVNTPLAVARIFHGMHSPRHQAYDWKRHGCWGRLMHMDFLEVFALCKKAMLQHLMN